MYYFIRRSYSILPVCNRDSTIPYGNICCNYIDVCQSAACWAESKSLKAAMNLNVDPCEDFYQFACGKFLNATEEDTSLSWDTLSQKSK
mgnify:CR=1 FL=1